LQQQYQPQPQNRQQPKKSGSGGAVFFGILIFLLATVTLLYVYFVGFNDRMTQIIVTIGVLVVALTVTLIIVFSKRKIHGVVKTIAILSVLIAIGAVVFSFIESDEDMITGRISTFESAINSGDLSLMIDCFDPVTRTGLHATAGIGSSILSCVNNLTGSNTDVDIADIIRRAIDLGAVFDVYAPTITITVLSVEINGDRAVAYVAINAGSQEVITSIPMIKSNMDWYINGFG
jgi:hypothetical protein